MKSIGCKSFFDVSFKLYDVNQILHYESYHKKFIADGLPFITVTSEVKRLGSNLTNQGFFYVRTRNNAKGFCKNLRSISATR